MNQDQYEVEILHTRLQLNQTMIQTMAPDIQSMLQKITEETQDMQEKSERCVQRLSETLPEIPLAQRARIKYLLDRISERQIKLAQSVPSKPLRYIRDCQRYFRLLSKLEMIANKINNK